MSDRIYAWTKMAEASMRVQANKPASSPRQRSRPREDSGERRIGERIAESALGVISYQGARFSTSCKVLDISANGARLELDLDDWVNPISSARSLPSSFRLMVTTLGFEADCSVAWREKASLGVRFVGKVRLLPRQFRKLRTFGSR